MPYLIKLVGLVIVLCVVIMLMKFVFTISIRGEIPEGDNSLLKEIEDNLENKQKIVDLLNEFALSYSKTASASNQLRRFEPEQFNHIKVLKFYKELIDHTDISDYRELIFELFEYHLNEQLLVVKDNKISLLDKQIIIQKNFISFQKVMNNITSLDEKLAQGKSDEEKEYLLQRASKHSELMDKIAKDIEENKAIFVK